MGRPKGGWSRGVPVCTGSRRGSPAFASIGRGGYRFWGLLCERPSPRTATVPSERPAGQIECLVIAMAFLMGRQADEKLPEMEAAAA
jgi:hypothetical protein